MEDYINGYFTIEPKLNMCQISVLNEIIEKINFPLKVNENGDSLCQKWSSNFFDTKLKMLYIKHEVLKLFTIKGSLEMMNEDNQIIKIMICE
jgi:hypothetical protein